MRAEVFVDPIQRSRLSQQVVVQLCRLVRQGTFRAGDRLPSERELAEQFGIGRSTLREALRALEIAGVVESRHGGGTFVRDFLAEGVLSPLALVLDSSDDVVGDLWEVRIMFEPAIAARAAVRASSVELCELQRIFDVQSERFESALDSDIFLEHDREFHIAIARASRNQVAVRVVHLIKQLLLESRKHFVLSPERVANAYERHRAILEAIQARDPRRAHDAMLRHLQDVEAHILGEIFDDGSLRP